MDQHDPGHHGSSPTTPSPADLDRLARQATTHCLTGCAIGEVLGMVIAGLTGLAAGPAVALSVALAFVFGYGLTMRPLLAGGTGLRAALGLALAADTISITVMEVVDNGIILVVPGAMDAGIDSLLFWGALAIGFAVAWLVTYPINRWLIARGRGHAVLHGAH
ncbi:MAG: DUF4396 domain-containing protein [Chloroflexi bacterium]|nr:DUF4396 domain-containing protein [Chloroflexota bacterium]